MKESARKFAEREAGTQLRLVGLKDLVQRELREFVVSAGMSALGVLLEEERTALCGQRYEHQSGRRAHRGGHVPGELVMGGRRVSVKRPRARSVDGDELRLPSWEEFSLVDPLHERALTQMIVGVSTRKYERSLEPVAATVKTRGTSKSTVSRRFIEITEEQMRELFQRRLDELDLIAIMLDGVNIAEHVIVVALGVDTNGQKHVLGIREGATENAATCTALLTDLRSRGMSTDKTTLFVLDGGKALRKAVVDVFGERAKIQRCQAHKLRNVLDQLPDYMRPTVKSTMQQAYACNNVVHARKLLQNLSRTLGKDHPSAAGSLDEGLEETLTVMAMRLSKPLERFLSTTNAVENLIGSVRDIGHCVKRWRDADMIVRWTATAVLEAGSKFRRISGYKDVPNLVRVLRGHETIALEQNIA